MNEVKFTIDYFDKSENRKGKHFVYAITITEATNKFYDWIKFVNSDATGCETIDCVILSIVGDFNF